MKVRPKFILLLVLRFWLFLKRAKVVTEQPHRIRIVGAVDQVSAISAVIFLRGVVKINRWLLVASGSVTFVVVVAFHYC